MWKVAVVAQFELSWHAPEEIEENHGESRHNRFLSRGWNTGSCTQDAGPLPSRLYLPVCHVLYFLESKL